MNQINFKKPYKSLSNREKRELNKERKRKIIEKRQIINRRNKYKDLQKTEIEFNKNKLIIRGYFD